MDIKTTMIKSILALSSSLISQCDSNNSNMATANRYGTPTVPSGKQTVCELENGPVEIVDLPINSMVIFHSFLYVYQRVDPPIEFWSVHF